MYRLPETLDTDIQKFGALAKDYQDKKIEATQFKAFRVPMGIYEQRQDEVYMSRVRTTGGVISPRQLLQVIEIAGRHQSNLLHITTRQEVQIQNLQLDEVEPVMHELKAIGLSTKGGGGNTIRNIIVSEWSGIDPDEQFDATPYAMELTSRLIAEADSYLLPRKMKIAFSSNEKHIGYAAINDIGLVARVRNGQKGFFVYAGGGAGAKPTLGWTLFEFLPVEDLYVLAEALKKFFSDYGNRKNRHKARLRFVFYKLGEQETIRLIRSYFETQKKEQYPPFVVNETTLERHEYLSGDFPRDTTEEFQTWKRRYATPQKQAGYYSILVPVLLGNIHLNDTAYIDTLTGLLQLVDKLGVETLRFTTTQNIRLRNIPDSALPIIFSLLKGIVADVTAPRLLNNIVSCTGADTCRLGIGLSKGLATAIRRELLKRNLDWDALQDARIHISGCPNSCGQQIWGDIGFSGKILRNNRIYPGYQIYLGANRGEKPSFAETIGSLNARDIPYFVAELLSNYLVEKEKYTSLREYLLSEGKKLALQLIDKHKQIPPFEEDKNYYFDWGAETLFSIVNRGAAECSAGLFDMIDVDQTIIDNTKKRLETESDSARRNVYLYEIVFSASRMLLVTRGVEPKTTEEVFNLFLRSFIEYGFVNEKFRDIVTTARDNKEANFESRKAEIFALADAVSELYKDMDDSLQFKGIKPKTEEETAKKECEVKEISGSVKRGADKFKDLRGVACPMNFVLTKIELSPMKSGETLEIWLDEGQPISNVPGSVRGEGHEILEQEKADEGYWKVVIKKK